MTSERQKPGELRIDFAQIELPAERYARLDEEREQERALDELFRMPPIGSRRGVEYYTGEYYG